MQFGHFDDTRREYVITSPTTPYPWINFLGTQDMFGIISNTAGGYSFYRDALYRRITRYRYNNVPVDTGGRYFYIKDGDTVWNPGWKPCKTALDSYECRHGQSYTIITGAKNGIEVQITFFVPLNATVELHRVKVTNTTDQPRRIQLFSFAEWCLWNALDDMTNFQRNFSTGEVEVDGSTLYHKTEYRERRNHYAFYSVNRPVDGFDTDRESFLGLYNGFHEPQVVTEGASRNSVAHGWHPIASHALTLELAPQKSDELVFSLGYVEVDEARKFDALHVINKQPARELIARYDNIAKVDQAFADLRGFWDSLFETYHLACGNEKLARMVNTWNQYQCVITYLFSRSASYFESGIGRGMGFRDSNQDLLGVVHQLPERARERILDIAATQKEDGGAFHQYQPLTKRGNTMMGDTFNDDPLWLILSTSAYIRETGDTSILEEKVAYENNDELARPLLDHLWRSYRYTCNNRGPHGLPLIGRADWNDCLNLNIHSTDPNESYQTGTLRSSGKAESVMIAGLFCYAAREFADLLEYLGKAEEAQEVRQGAGDMRRTIDDQGRDPEWFVRAYDHEGRKVGSQECEDGKIFIESQGWCIMGGCGLEDGFARTALDSVKKHLATPYGIVLQQPAYKEYHKELGEVSSYPPGYKENSGIFCHNNPWIMIAETILGNGEAAFDYYRKIAPAFLEEISDLHRTEPYCYSQMIAGKDAAIPGEAKNAWLTGTAAWNFVAISQHILGVRPQLKGLRVKPILPAEMLPLTITRRVRGTTFVITVQAGDTPGLVVDGEPVEGNEVPYPPKEGRTVTVTCTV